MLRNKWDSHTTIHHPPFTTLLQNSGRITKEGAERESRSPMGRGLGRREMLISECDLGAVLFNYITCILCHMWPQPEDVDGEERDISVSVQTLASHQGSCKQ